MEIFQYAFQVDQVSFHFLKRNDDFVNPQKAFFSPRGGRIILFPNVVYINLIFFILQIELVHACAFSMLLMES